MAVRGIELLVIKDVASRKEKGSGVKLRLVQWVFDNGTSIKLEKRSYFLSDAGEPRTGKAEGFGLNDLEALKPHWTKIMQLMKNPPKVEQASAPSEETQTLEEVPF